VLQHCIAEYYVIRYVLEENASSESSLELEPVMFISQFSEKPLNFSEWFWLKPLNFSYRLSHYQGKALFSRNN